MSCARDVITPIPCKRPRLQTSGLLDSNSSLMRQMNKPRRRVAAWRVGAICCATVGACPLVGSAEPFAAPDIATSLAPATGIDRERAIQCLTQAIYYEAGFEPRKGQEAVAQVVLNRVRRPEFPKSICGVIFDGASRATGCQFSFTCDGSLSRQPVARAWAQARDVAAQALDGHVDERVGSATHYHASWMIPYWQSSMVETARIGNHIFYEWPGSRGSWGSLSDAYSGVEPDVGTGTPTRISQSRSGRAGAKPVRPAPRQASTFSVWGLQVATVTPRGQTLRVQPD
jgi:hypothetical protein